MKVYKKGKMQKIKMAKNVYTAQIAKWEHSVRSEYPREWGSREHKTTKEISERGREEGEKAEQSCQKALDYCSTSVWKLCRISSVGCMAVDGMRRVNIQLFFSKLVSKQTSAMELNSSCR